MKTAIAILAILLATAALAAPMYDPQGARHETPPTKVGDTHNVTPEMLVLDGWSYETEAQAAEYAAQLAAQAAASEATMNLPAVFDNGVAVIDEQGHHIELVPLGDGEEVVGIQISNSPLDASVREQMKAEKLAKLVAKKAAKDANRTAEVDKLVKKIDKAKDVKELGNAIVAYIEATKE